mmetsp:Transcript_520/g.783  ORF Transcript_520/g.783 Transcript_520/m.783 type:complete len:267 (-) Transcript_520:20-820(-)
MGNNNQKSSCCSNQSMEKSESTAPEDDSSIYVTRNVKNTPSNSRSLVMSDSAKQTSSAIYPDLYEGHFSSLLIPYKDLDSRCKEIAEHIHATYPSDEPLVMLCILKGSAPFYNLLCNHLSILGHPFMIDFYRVKSYEGTGSSGTVKHFGDLPKSMKGRHVLVIEDIVDTGTTLKSLLPTIAEKDPKSYKVCSMLVKRFHSEGSEDDDEDDGGEITKQIELDNNLIGFNIPNAFVVGCGLDYNEMYRDLRDIWILGEEGIKGGGYDL